MNIKVVIVDDSAFMRKILKDIIDNSPNMQVVGSAKNGKEALEVIKKLKPDVVTLDVEMPVMDGLTALKEIMNKNPVPVVMLSSYTKEGADLTFKALELGAIDFISKPSSIFKVNTEDVIKELVEKIEIASKVKPKKNVFHGYEKKSSERTVSTVEKFKKNSSFDSEGKINNIIAIGTSTGGPKALQEVLPKFPANINASIIIVQHMPPKFTKSLAERLNGLSNINVKEAEDGEVLMAGWAYIAPGDKHLHLQHKGLKYYISLSDGPLVSGHKPSADSMFYSVADTKLKNIIGVIMTGMGADGAKGLVRIKNENKGYIIAQNEESCIVFGMPKSAIAENVVDKVCDLSQITSEIMKAMGV